MKASRIELDCVCSAERKMDQLERLGILRTRIECVMLRGTGLEEYLAISPTQPLQFLKHFKKKEIAISGCEGCEFRPSDLPRIKLINSTLSMLRPNLF